MTQQPRRKQSIILSLLFTLTAILFASNSRAQQSANPSQMQSQAYSYTSTGTHFANLFTQCGSGNQPPNPPNCAPQNAGTSIFCSDCMANTMGACTGGGNGAIAKRVGTTWKCADMVNLASMADLSNYNGP